MGSYWNLWLAWLISVPAHLCAQDSKHSRARPASSGEHGQWMFYKQHWKEDCVFYITKVPVLTPMFFLCQSLLLSLDSHACKIRLMISKNTSRYHFLVFKIHNWKRTEEINCFSPRVVSIENVNSGGCCLTVLSHKRKQILLIIFLLKYKRYSLLDA